VANSEGVIKDIFLNYFGVYDKDTEKRVPPTEAQLFDTTLQIISPTIDLAAERKRKTADQESPSKLQKRPNSLA
ncbi:hypothetical protein N9Y92_04305, partial [Chlamydiales bacterium]|nr:hypothetical protein [Chlamydiales bacterium]